MTTDTHSGSKYLRDVALIDDKYIDVYAVLVAFNVTCPARQHAIKKLLCSGIRGKGDVLQDLKVCRDAIDRAIQLANTEDSIYINIPDPVVRKGDYVGTLHLS